MGGVFQNEIKHQGKKVQGKAEILVTMKIQFWEVFFFLTLRLNVSHDSQQCYYVMNISP